MYLQQCANAHCAERDIGPFGSRVSVAARYLSRDSLASGKHGVDLGAGASGCGTEGGAIHVRLGRLGASFLSTSLPNNFFRHVAPHFHSCGAICEQVARTLAFAVGCRRGLRVQSHFLCELRADQFVVARETVCDRTVANHRSSVQRDGEAFFAVVVNDPHPKASLPCQHSPPHLGSHDLAV